MGIGIQDGRGVNTGKFGMLKVQNNAEIDAAEDLQRRLNAAMEAQQKGEIAGIAKIVKDAWQTNRDYRQESGVDERLIGALRQYNSRYPPNKLAAIREEGGTEMFMGLTKLKCRAGEAWARDVLNSDQDRPWTMKPTPIPELPPSIEEDIADSVMETLQQNFLSGGEPPTIQQLHDMAADIRDEIDDRVKTEADDRAKRMETLCHDQQVEGGWKKAFSDFLKNMSIFPTAFIKGPIIRSTKRMTYPVVDGRTKVKVENVLTMQFEAPNPMDIYPSRGATTTDEGDLIERMRLSPAALEAMIGVPGWNQQAIELVLAEYGRGGLREWTSIDTERSELERKGSDLASRRNDMQALEYWGGIQGRDLTLDGITEDLHGKPLNPLSVYEVNAILIGNYLVYKGLNPDLMGDRTYSMCSWEELPGAFWGNGVPAMMEDIQDGANANMRALINNEAIGSGPQVVYNDISRLPDGEDPTAIYPLKVHLFDNAQLSMAKPIDFFTVPIKAQELMGVFEKFANMADEHTGIPSYAHGNDNIKGAGATMGGLSILMTSAARGIKMVIGQIDMNVIHTVLLRQFRHNMLYNPDESIKGDVEIQPRGALAQIVKEQMTARRVEYLNVTNNETDRQLTGLEGRRLVLDETSKSLDIPGKRVRSKEEIEQLEQELKQAQIAAIQQEAQAEQAGAA